jgi:hypothetical protein
VNGLDHTVEYFETGLREFPQGSLRLVLIAMLGLVFVWSGSAKARSPWNAAFAAVDFGVARRPSLRIAWIVAGGELSLAAVLLVSPAISSAFAVAAATVAAITLIVFCALIARALRAGRSFDCACFGADSEGLSGRTMIRSGTLAVIALACAAAGSFGSPLGLGELLLTWCAAAGLLAIPALLVRAQLLVRLWRTSMEANI